MRRKRPQQPVFAYQVVCILSLIIYTVAAHLRGMRPTLTTRKAIQCLEETQTLTELLL